MPFDIKPFGKVLRTPEATAGEDLILILLGLMSSDTVVKVELRNYAKNLNKIIRQKKLTLAGNFNNSPRQQEKDLENEKKRRTILLTKLRRFLLNYEINFGTRSEVEVNHFLAEFLINHVLTEG